MAYELKGRRDPSDTLPVQILRTFVVHMPQVTRADIQRMLRQATDKEYDQARGEAIERINPERYARAYLQAFIRSWEGLTEDILMELAPADISETLLLPDPVDGCFPCDHTTVVLRDAERTYTLPEYLWARAWPVLFSQKLERTNERWLAAKQALDEEKKRSSSTSAV